MIGCSLICVTHSYPVPQETVSLPELQGSHVQMGTLVPWHLLWGLLLKIQRNDADRYFLGGYKFDGEFWAQLPPLGKWRYLAHSLQKGGRQVLYTVASQLTRAGPSNLSP